MCAPLYTLRLSSSRPACWTRRSGSSAVAGVRTGARALRTGRQRTWQCACASCCCSVSVKPAAAHPPHISVPASQNSPRALCQSGVLTLCAPLVEQGRHGVEQRVDSKRGVTLLGPQVVGRGQRRLLVRAAPALTPPALMLGLRLGGRCCCVVQAVVVITSLVFVPVVSLCVVACRQQHSSGSTASAAQHQQHSIGSTALAAHQRQHSRKHPGAGSTSQGSTTCEQHDTRRPKQHDTRRPCGLATSPDSAQQARVTWGSQQQQPGQATHAHPDAPPPPPCCLPGA